ncbi:hypothetical protein RvY_12963 [Ramazzottius varieornatus]|uniref:Uncharacterized protein n=1 Tax=Ramazzottius varieornatus TaxID=947166 RepID=A0A1D1VN82_RAMVA|nr:hypothetical protein RvY_12963 [Ramazzottius varieornatus]
MIDSWPRQPHRPSSATSRMYFTWTSWNTWTSAVDFARCRCLASDKRMLSSRQLTTKSIFLDFRAPSFHSSGSSTQVQVREEEWAEEWVEAAESFMQF